MGKVCIIGSVVRTRQPPMAQAPDATPIDIANKMQSRWMTLTKVSPYPIIQQSSGSACDDELGRSSPYEERKGMTRLLWTQTGEFLLSHFRRRGQTREHQQCRCRNRAACRRCSLYHPERLSQVFLGRCCQH